MIFLKFINEKIFDNFFYLPAIVFIFNQKEVFPQGKIMSLAELQKTKLYKSIEEALPDAEMVYRINLF